MKVKILKAYETEFLARLKKLQKKAKVTITSKEEGEETQTRIIRYEDYTDEKTERVKTITFQLDSPFENYKVNGYTFYGLFYIDKSGTEQVLSANKDKPIFETIQKKLSFPCYHCNKKIERRIKRFYFTKDDTGEIISLGSTCANDYFGFQIAYTLEKGIGYLKQINDMSGEYGGGSGNKIRYGANYDSAMYWSIMLFKAGIKYISKSKVQYDFDCQDNATADDLSQLIACTNPGFNQRIREQAKTTSEEIAKLIPKIETFYGNIKPSNDFEYNVKNMFEKRGDNYGILVWAVYNYFWKQQPKIEKKIFEYYPNPIVTNEKVTCVNVSTFEGLFGTGRCIVLVNDKYKFVCLTSGGVDVNKGEQYNIKKATVKKTEEYKGEKQTRIKLNVKSLEMIS